jgi:hypothetical protein
MLLSCVHLHARQKPPVAETEYYSFLNDFFQPGDDKGNYLLADLNAIKHVLTNTASLFWDNSFTRDDIAFMRRQIAYALRYKWEKNRIEHATIIADKDIKSLFGPEHKGDGWLAFYNNYKMNGYKTFSVPLFSLDRQTCIFYYTYNCGWLCGNGRLCIYRKKENKWVLQRNISTWVS